ncbi:hypothetical protein Sjap_005372 [Stephania japonica]|uniref:Pectinesterase n=1 Tax=Stephania japonica TaxID=461633 RepID=A0AAP0K5D6_9MAGN
MGYGRLGAPSESFRSTGSAFDPPPPAQTSAAAKKRKKLILLSSFTALLLVACAVSAALLVHFRTKSPSASEPLSQRKPSQAISKACKKTRYPDLCVNSLVDFPGALAAGERDLVHISFNMTLQRVGKALFGVSEITNFKMDQRLRSAYDDCLELLEDSMDQLTQSLFSIAPSTESDSDGAAAGSTDDVVTWLSAALTNQDTCAEGFEDVNVIDGAGVKGQVESKLKELSELVSNCLSLYAASSDDDGSGGGDFSGVPVQNRRRLLEKEEKEEDSSGGFPKWLSRKDRALLGMPISAIQADIVVSKEGNGTYKTIDEAIKAAPEKSSRRTIIYVKAGRYEEKMLKVGRKKTNLMFIGDGKGKTVITGSKSVADGLTTFHTPSFAATGAGFIARDITFENTAGPAKHQAAALRVGADHSVVYHCDITGYQDSLYVHSQRQFYRECDIYGTVDFIFGNAAVVFQKCNIFARKPMAQQKVTITAQNRKDPNQNTGISIHNCRILPGPDLNKGSTQTFLGRPWKMYSRVVYLLNYMGDHISPHGWLEWNGDFALDTLYYGEYMNYGPGAAVGQRVKWPGYRVITSTTEASKFTVAQFIYGSSWLPSTGVAFVAGLSV